jgi:hypothetical protein
MYSKYNYAAFFVGMEILVVFYSPTGKVHYLESITPEVKRP